MLSSLSYRVFLAGLLIAFSSHSLPTAYAKNYPNPNAPSNSNITTLSPQFFPNLNSSRVKITYGPWNVPSMDIENGMEDYFIENMTMPCTDCIITWMQAGFEYPNGSYANANTSLWLHHTFLVNAGRPDVVCGMGWGGERFFASGNERTIVDISMNGTDQVGYYIGPTDNVYFEAELMNADMVNQTAVVTITYEYIPNPPSSFIKAIPVWLDIGGCDQSEQPAQANTTFDYVSPAWTANVSGKITAMLAHLHDGGVNLDILSNNQTVCNDVASYGQSPGFISPMDMSMGMNMNMTMPPMNDSTTMSDMFHISSISACSGQEISTGEQWTIVAHYNTSEYAPMLDTDGGLMPIMGISLFFVAPGQVGSNTTLNVGADGMVVANSSSSGSATSTMSTATATSTSGCSTLRISSASAVIGVVVGILTIGVAGALI